MHGGLAIIPIIPKHESNISKDQPTKSKTTKKDWLKNWDSLEVIKDMIENQGFRDIHCTDENGLNALILACFSGNLEIVKYLIENPIIPFREIHAKTRFGENAFINACKQNQLEIIQYLLENYICPFEDIYAKDRKWKTGFDYARTKEVRLYLKQVNPYICQS